MLSVTYSAALYGIDAFIVTIECSTRRDVFGFEVVGLPDMAVRESEKRIVTAFRTLGIRLPDAAVTVNLAPADRRKEGSALDMGIFVAMSSCMGVLPTDTPLREMCFIGELSFTGDIRPVRGVLSMALAAANHGIHEIFVPAGNLREASAAAGEGVHIYGVSNAGQLIAHIRGQNSIEPVSERPTGFGEDGIKVLGDFSQVKGQLVARRAVEIAAAGGHNMLMVGPPGSGKSMIAKRIPTILPSLTYDEAIITTKIHSAAGILDENCGMVPCRPFRSPHHSLSTAALVGGGKIPMPGEISLAHGGVLFLDEFPEFSKNALESLRAPLEDGEVTITRAAGRVTFPAGFMMVCAMNPCRCGYFGSKRGKCTCSPADVRNYLSKLSGPMLDRIDIQVEMPELEFSELSSRGDSESSADIKKRVEAAREIARIRFRQLGRKDWALASNSKLDTDGIKYACYLDDGCTKLLEASFQKLNLSARAYDRILRVARTIADISHASSGGDPEKPCLIGKAHLLEAVQMRKLDKYFK